MLHLPCRCRPMCSFCIALDRYVVCCVQGHNLNSACGVEEVTVWVGNATCKVNSLDAVTLYCSPPPVVRRDLLPTVTVRATAFILYKVQVVPSVKGSGTDFCSEQSVCK